MQGSRPGQRERGDRTQEKNDSTCSSGPASFNEVLPTQQAKAKKETRPATKKGKEGEKLRQSAGTPTPSYEEFSKDFVLRCFVGTKQTQCWGLVHQSGPCSNAMSAAAKGTTTQACKPHPTPRHSNCRQAHAPLKKGFSMACNMALRRILKRVSVQLHSALVLFLTRGGHLAHIPSPEDCLGKRSSLKPMACGGAT